MFSADAIIQTIGNIVGGTAGAFLGGWFAIKVMKKQMNFQLQEAKREREEKFEKTYWLLKIAFEGIGKVTEETYKTLNNPAVVNPNHVYIIGKLTGVIRSAEEKLSMVNDEYVPKEIYKEYLYGKTLFSLCEITINRWNEKLFSSGEKDKEFIIDKDSEEFKRLYENGTKLKLTFKKIDNFKESDQRNPDNVQAS